MNPICNILVIVDPTADRHPAVTKGALLAEQFNARLELFVCDTKAARETRLGAHARAGGGETLVASPKALLESLAEPLRARGLDVTTETVWADPLHVGLLDRVRRTSAELVVKDTHHHTLAQRTLLTNTDWQLIRGCPVPLLLTKGKPWAAAPRIFAAVDPGHSNDKPALLDHRILEQAGTLSRRLGGELHVLHAYLPMIVVTSAAEVPPMISAEDLVREREFKLKGLSQLVSDYKVNAQNIHLELGGPVEVLPRIAGELSVDIMTMGAISRSGLQRAFIGSTAESVLERLPCDALIVKPLDFAELLPF